MATGNEVLPAVAIGGPLDGKVLGSATAEQFEVRMADNTNHVYVRSSRPSAGEWLYTYTGRR